MSMSHRSVRSSVHGLQIDILFIEGCPNSDAALVRAREAIANEGAAAEIRMVEIRDAGDAIAQRFLGSPTIQIDGQDAEPEARLRRDYGFMCRTYRASNGSVAGAPSVDLIATAIKGRLSAKS
jgi:hypothetical protein